MPRPSLLWLAAMGLFAGCNTAADRPPPPAPPPSASALVTATGAPAGTGEAPTATEAPASASATTSGAPSASATMAAAASPPASSGPCPEGMIRIPGGTLPRHKPGPRRSAAVSDFCLDRTEVTVLAYKACVRDKKCSPRCLEIGRCTAVPSDADWPDPREAVRASTFCNGTRNDRDEHPVNCVSFDEAKAYCGNYDKRLPSGDEWEWAAVGAKPIPIFPWGARAPEKDELCWGKPHSRPSTCLPGSMRTDTTRDGVVDMTGNLSEWVIEGKPEKPRARLRGASWYAIDDGYVEAALWGFESTSTRSEVFGFRCARDVKSP